jgi:hypothetical protein
VPKAAQFRPVANSIETFTCVNHIYRKAKNRLLKFCYVPATSAAQNRLLFFFFLLRLFTVLMNQARQALSSLYS